MRREKQKFTILFLTGAVLMAVFFLAYAYLPLSAPHLFNSPDEMSNHYFSSLFSDSSELWNVKGINIQAEGRLHPRSIRVVDMFLVPGGFIGMPVLFGGIAKVLGNGAIVYLTPLFALLAVIAWGALVSMIFSVRKKEGDAAEFTSEGIRVGLVASLLLLSNPVWWYVTARTMMPNSLFVSLLIIGVTVFLVRPIDRVFRWKGGDSYSRLRILDFVIAGVCLAFAFAVRPSELPWVLMSAAVIGIIYRKVIPVFKLAVTAVSGLITAAPLLLLHYSAYGSIFSSGYGETIGGVSGAVASGGFGMRLLGPLQPYLFPLGFAPRTALQNFFTYGVSFFWWWSVVVVLGAAVLFMYRDKKEKASQSVRALGWTSAIVAGWLILFYGSWIVQDNPDPNAVTIGSSYFRYWLPLFVLSTIVAARATIVFADRLKGGGRAFFVPVIVTVLACASAFSVFTSPQEGLSAIRENLERYEGEVESVLATTEKDSVIVVDRADKLLFPARNVMYPLRDDETYATLGKLKGSVPLYYYGITLPDEDVAYLRDERLAPLGLSVEHVETFSEESLYEFIVMTEKE